MTDAVHPPARWETDQRGVGVGDARGHLAPIEALRDAAERAGWVAEAPEDHLLPHLRRHAADASPWVIDATRTLPDGTFEVDVHWSRSPSAGHRDVREAAFALIGAIAEGATAVHERRTPDALTFEVVTGMLPGDTDFATHGHTVRLRVTGPAGAGAAADPDD